MSKLYIIPTPIGNLEDITFRALRILKEVDVILAEDTRTSGKLLKHFEVTTSLRSYHMHNEHKITDSVIKDMEAGGTFALITDAGTPAISDPGYLLVRACIDHGIEVECLPGATAFVPALVVSGLPAHEFSFIGFIPVKKGRQKKLQELQEEKRTFILYESPHKLLRTLQDIKECMGEDRLISVSRELSKLYEQHVRGTVTEVLQHFEKHAPKGEFVLVVHGKS